MITRAIVTIKNPLIRCPLWVAWWPVAVLDCCIAAITEGWAERMLLAEYWRNQWKIFLIGIDGWDE